jgi:putative acetyltransferase
VADLLITTDDPRRPDVLALLGQHLELMRAPTPAEFVFALDVEGLVDPAITFCSARDADGALVGVGALKELDGRHGELKSMHTAAAARGRGVAVAVLDHLLDLARGRGYDRVSLETGSQDAFAAARRLYARSGFAPCGPFSTYADNPSSVFMTLAL